MNTERLFKIVIMDLTTDNFKLEQELERVINSDKNTDLKTQTIKLILSKMVSIDASITKFTSMFNNNNNNNEVKEKEND
jgi:thymidylate synthase